jgi:micrococcal nuclease
MSSAATVPKGYTLITSIIALVLMLAGVNEFYVQTPYEPPFKKEVESLLTPEMPKEDQYFEVTRVVDGDTLELDVVGLKEKVRLIGINTPEVVDPRKPVECFGKEASNRMKELAKGQKVRIEYDETQGYRDMYDRMLAYVYLEDGQMLNRKMLAEGYAYEYTYNTPYRYQKEFRSLVELARTSERGLWAKNACAQK